MRVLKAQVPKINKQINKQVRCSTACRKNYMGKKHETSQHRTITGYPEIPTSFENL